MLKNDLEMKLIIVMLFVLFIIIAHNRFFLNHDNNTKDFFEIIPEDSLFNKENSLMKLSLQAGGVSI